MRLLCGVALLTCSQAQAQAQAPDSLAGTWRGTSVCQVPLPCRDEIAVYHVAPASSPDRRIIANKVVAGVEEEMGVLDGRWDAAAGRFVGTTHDRQGRPATWTFTLARGGHHLAGRMVGPTGQLMRLIELERVPAPGDQPAS